jgi:hypothetical protein
LTIALRHDEVNVEGENFVGSIRMSGAYDIAWQEFLDYPVAPANFKAFEEEFVARSNKCDICVEGSNLSLEDDTFEDTLDEGGTYNINVATNDSICCSNPVFAILSFDTDYIDSISIDQVGEVTMTLKTPLSSAPDKQLFTYKVTCSDSSEATASVYGTVEGTTTPLCEAPTDVILSLIGGSLLPAEIHAEWTAPGSPPADGYGWLLLKRAGFGWSPPISFGTTTDTFLNINGLDCDERYKFLVRSVCDEGTGDYSSYASDDIEVPACGGVPIPHAIYSNNPFTHCGQPTNTVYTIDGTISPGKTIYNDAAMSVIVTGFSFISNDDVGIIYNLNSLTGVVGSNTGESC